MTSVTRWQTFPYILMWMMIILEIPQRNRERAKSMIMLMKAPEDRTDGRYDISVLPHWITQPGWITTMRNPWLVLLLAASWQLLFPASSRIKTGFCKPSSQVKLNEVEGIIPNMAWLISVAALGWNAPPITQRFFFYTTLYPDDPKCFCMVLLHLGTPFPPKETSRSRRVGISFDDLGQGDARQGRPGLLEGQGLWPAPWKRMGWWRWMGGQNGIFFLRYNINH